MRIAGREQSERSVATAAFLFAGAAFGLLNVTLFRVETGQPRFDVLVLAALCLLCGVGVLLRGRRFSTASAAVVMVLALLAIGPTTAATPSELRAVNVGLLFFPYFIYVVWFFPMRAARALGYAWLLAYSLVVVAKYGAPMFPVLTTLALTGIVLGELIGRFKRRLERASITDPLTDVWNKRGFERLLAKAIANAQRSGRPLALLYIDLDEFKHVNDRYGHREGDRVLQEFARAMQERVRPQDVFSRFGGDEFALLLADCDTAQARITGARLQREVSSTPWSFGVSEWRRGELPADFVSRADLLMLSGKRGRRAAEPASGAE